MTTAVAAPMRLELPVPFPIASVNAYLFTGERPALVDCGVGGDPGYRNLVESLARHGHTPDTLEALHITHGHVDHAGNAARLGTEHGVPLHAPREEAPFVETFRAESARRNDAYMEALLRHGAPPEVAHRVRQRSGEVDTYLEDTRIDHAVQDGQRILLGDQEATAVRTPGHTPGSVCFLLEEEPALLSGDTLLETITSNALELRDAQYGAQHRYVQTLESLRRFVGCTALPGHGPPFSLTDALLDRHRERQDRRAARILALLERPRTAWSLLDDLFRGHLREEGIFLAMAEAVGHLHALEIDARVQRVEEDGVRRFVRAG